MNKPKAYTSQYALDEIVKAPEPKKNRMLNLLSEFGIAVLPPSEEARRLADIYVKRSGIPEKKRFDPSAPLTSGAV